MSKRKRYSPEYKRELVELVRRSQSSCRQIVSDQQTAGWRSSLRRDEDGCAARMFHGSRAS